MVDRANTKNFSPGSTKSRLAAQTLVPRVGTQRFCFTSPVPGGFTNRSRESRLLVEFCLDGNGAFDLLPGAMLATGLGEAAIHGLLRRSGPLQSHAWCRFSGTRPEFDHQIWFLNLTISPQFWLPSSFSLMATGHKNRREKIDSNRNTPRDFMEKSMGNSPPKSGRICPETIPLSMIAKRPTSDSKL